MAEKKKSGRSSKVLLDGNTPRSSVGPCFLRTFSIHLILSRARSGRHHGRLVSTRHGTMKSKILNHVLNLGLGIIKSANMSKEPPNGLIRSSEAIRNVGAAICIASILCALKSKAGSNADTYAILFFACVSILMGVSAFYFVARLFSERWRSKALRSCFSPYIIGAMIWIVLIPLLMALSWT